MKISVVIPVFNVKDYLSSCLDSVLSQTFPYWEAICVNDGSTDGSGAILASYAAKDSRFQVITQSNGGLSAARNIGLKAAQGDYILFLDSDDWLEVNALQTLAQNIDGEDMLCFSGRRYFEETGMFNQTDTLQNAVYATGMEYYNENALLHRDFAFVCVVLRLYRRLFLMDYKLFFTEGIFHEDNLFTPIACYYAKKIKVINACLYNYRVRENSITTTVNTKRLSDFLEIANSLAAFFISKNGIYKTVIYRAITHHYQVVFSSASPEDKYSLSQNCKWLYYRKVSRTKLRHRINYLKYRFL